MATKTSTKPQPTTLREEQEAAAQERIARVTPTTLRKVQRVHELKRLMAPYLAEIEDIKGDVFKEMDKKDADILTYKGVPVVSRNKAVTRQMDWDTLFKDYSEIAGILVSNKETYRVDWKKPVV